MVSGHPFSSLFSCPLCFQCVLLICSCFSGPRKPVRGRHCSWRDRPVPIAFSSWVSHLLITAFSGFSSETRLCGRSRWLLQKHPQSQCSLPADPGGGRVAFTAFRFRCVFTLVSCHYSQGLALLIASDSVRASISAQKRLRWVISSVRCVCCLAFS